MTALLDAHLTVTSLRTPILKAAGISIQPGEILALAGQSGAGKSTFALALLGLLPRPAFLVHGRALLDGADLLTLPERALRSLRGRAVSLVPQSPLSSLNPRLTLGSMFQESWRAHARSDFRRPVAQALAAVDLPSSDEFLARYPRTLSVGMAQRVLIAMAVLHRPRLLIADEPTSALDLITQSEVLALFRRLNLQHGTALLFITHDLAAAATLAHRAAVLHLGSIVEAGPASQLFTAPTHPYTRQLLASVPPWPARSPQPAPQPQAVADHRQA